MEIIIYAYLTNLVLIKLFIKNFTDLHPINYLTFFILFKKLTTTKKIFFKNCTNFFF